MHMALSLHRKWRMNLDKSLRRYTDLIGSLDVVIVEKLKSYWQIMPKTSQREQAMLRLGSLLML